MNIVRITQIFIASAFVVIFGYDFYAWIFGGTEATISWQIYQFSYNVPAFTFGMGFIMGHLFWQMEKKDKD